MTHPITPPPELLQLWFEQYHDYGRGLNELLIDAARYGADQELEACCVWLSIASNHGLGLSFSKILPEKLRAARRPKPPSLKQQALDLLKTDLEPGQEVASITLPAKSIDTIRRALEALPDK